MNIGVIGMGKMGLLHMGILNSLDGVRVSAVSDTEKLVTNFLRTIDGLAIYTDYKKMIEDSTLDAIYITTPVSSHIPIASFCAERKIPFFVEKPLGKNAKECINLCNMIKENKIPSMVGFCLRYVETFTKAKELLTKESLGDIKSIKSSVYRSQLLTKSSGWRFKKDVSGGGVLIDIGIHLIDLLLWYFGNIASVDGTIKSQHLQEVEDTVTSTIKFENGLQCSFDASWNAPNYRLQETTIEVVGALGTMKVNEDFVNVHYNEPGHEKQNETFYRQSLYKSVPIDIAGPEYTREDLDFIECVRTGKLPMLNVLDSSRTQSVVDSIYESSKNRKLELVKYIE
jgi:predicted dehydrogenase